MDMPQPTVPFLVPFPRRRSFVGREDDLSKLHDALQGQVPVGIHSLGPTNIDGIGKTQLVVEYVYRYREHYPRGVFWVNAAEPLNEELARLGLELFPQQAGPSSSDRIDLIARYLRGNSESLLVFDSLSDPSVLNYSVGGRFTPTSLPCRILFTTQRNNLAPFVPFRVDKLPLEPSLQLLLHSRPPVLASHHPEHNQARVICRLLGYLPLALELAGALLAEWPHVSLHEFRTHLEKAGCIATPDEANRLPFANICRTAVRATLRILWETLDDDLARLLLRAAGQLPQVSLISATRLGLLVGESDLGDPGQPSSLTRALDYLQQRSLVAILREGLLGIHPLVHEFAAAQTPPEENTSFRTWLAGNLAATYEAIAVLEKHCCERGIEALEDDLAIALELAAAMGKHEQPSLGLLASLEGLLRTLHSESYNLRHCSPQLRPTYFAQQIHKQALYRGQEKLVAAAQSRLDQQGQPYLLLHWRAGKESAALVQTLSGHRTAVLAVAITSDGRYAVSASSDCTLKVWNLATHKELATLSGHQGWVRAVAISLDGRYVVSASSDCTLKVWDLTTYSEVATLAGHQAGVFAVVISPDGRQAVSASDDRTLKIWDLPTGSEVATLSGHQTGVLAVAISPDSRYAVSASSDCTLKVWNLATHKELATLSGHQGWVRAVAISPDGRYAVSASSDCTLKVWDLTTYSEIATLPGHRDRVHAVSILPNGHQAVSASDDRTLKIWDLSTRSEVATLTGHQAGVLAVAIAPDGCYAVSAAADCTLRVWNLSMHSEPPVLKGHRGRVHATAVSPDGRYAVSASDDGTLKVWGLATQTEAATLSGHRNWVRAVTISPNGRYAVSASDDHTLKIWDIPAHREVATLAGHSDFVLAVAISPDGCYALSASSDHTLKMWDLTTHREIATLVGHQARVRAVTISPDGHYAVSASDDRTLKVWDLATHSEITTLTGHQAPVRTLSISSDSHYAVSASDDHTLKVWDLTTHSEVATLTGHQTGVRAVALSSDGLYAISASSDCAPMIWDLATHAGSITLSSHQAAVRTVTISPDSHYGVSISDDCMVKVWDLATRAEIATVTLEAALSALCLGADGLVAIVGDVTGSVYMLQIVEQGRAKQG